RLEEHNTASKNHIEELNRTVTRLNVQLRNMTLETEAQIRFRKGNAEETSEAAENPQKELDPLELDRFSKLQLLSRSLTETANDLVNIRLDLEEQRKEIDTLLIQHERLSNDLQDGLLRTRMVPFSQMVSKLSRLVRKTADSVGKKAELKVEGAEGEMDRNILERIVAPMEHILRNAVGHGIETPQKRREAGKNEKGTITITIDREGNDVLITIADDGAGLNLPAIRKRAIENGLLQPNAQMEDKNLMQLILEPGFSTAQQVTQLSGRGVGTDVAVSEVKQLGGSLEISSRTGLGTSFLIRLPFTLALTQASLVSLGDDVFALPQSTIMGIAGLEEEVLHACYKNDQPSYKYLDNNVYPIRYLGDLLGTTSEQPMKGSRLYPHLFIQSGEHRLGIQVDQVIGQSQIVMKSVGPQLSTVRWISGGTILPNGRVVLILDASALLRMDVVKTASTVAAKKTKEELPPLVMVVDDSVTVRRITERLLTKRFNMRVVLAKDGQDALLKLQDHSPDVMLLDFEMPNMNGQQLTEQIRGSKEPRIKKLPIIMITSRTGAKHQEMARASGVNRYLGKPYDPDDLMKNIHEVISEFAMTDMED
ncbi:hypothetical protein TI05_05945, partial [Achromatium sp. WMS3]